LISGINMQTIDLRAETGELVVAGAAQFEEMLRQLLNEIVAAVTGDEEIAFIGIRSRGNHLAERLAAGFTERTGRRVDVGALDIGFYRDDFATAGFRQPKINDSKIDFSIDGKTVFLVDDVLYTGRTVRAALICFADLGRTRCIKLVELIDRGLREMPIQADFLAMRLITLPSQWVRVRVKEKDGEDMAIVSPSRASGKRK